MKIENVEWFNCQYYIFVVGAFEISIIHSLNKEVNN